MDALPGPSDEALLARARSVAAFLERGTQPNTWRPIRKLREPNGPTVFVVHGFRSQADPTEFLDHLDPQYDVLLFDYPSGHGVHIGGQLLLEAIRGAKTSFSRHGYALVGHSLGGLVVRAFEQMADRECVEGLRGIAVVGTPNKGIAARFLGRHPWVHELVRVALGGLEEGVSENAVQELLLVGASPIIRTLNQREAHAESQIPMLSISGGSRDVRESIGRVRSLLFQRLIDEPENDGIVGESNADVTKLPGITRGRHRRDYDRWAATNHFQLAREPEAGHLINAWLRQIFGPSGPHAGPTRPSS